MKKKLALGLTSLVVASAMAIGGTLAFMTNQTKEMTNTFKAIGANVSGQLREPAWNNFHFDQFVNWNQEPKGSDVNWFDANYKPLSPDQFNALGVNQANQVKPNMTIPKDPTLKNKSLIPVYMAIKVTYDKNAKDAFFTPVKHDAIYLPDAPKTAPVASFTVNAGWSNATNVIENRDGTRTEIYFYGTTISPKAAELTVKPPKKDIFKLTAVQPEDVTNPLFNNIHINRDIGFEALEKYKGECFKAGFGLTITGAAIQTSDITDEQAQQLLVQALNTKK